MSSDALFRDIKSGNALYVIKYAKYCATSPSLPTFCLGKMPAAYACTEKGFLTQLRKDTLYPIAQTIYILIVLRFSNM